MTGTFERGFAELEGAGTLAFFRGEPAGDEACEQTGGGGGDRSGRLALSGREGARGSFAKTEVEVGRFSSAGVAAAVSTLASGRGRGGDSSGEYALGSEIDWRRMILGGLPAPASSAQGASACPVCAWAGCSSCNRSCAASASPDSRARSTSRRGSADSAGSSALSCKAARSRGAAGSPVDSFAVEEDELLTEPSADWASTWTSLSTWPTLSTSRSAANPRESRASWGSPARPSARPHKSCTCAWQF
jgi:hypothetical protein